MQMVPLLIQDVNLLSPQILTVQQKPRCRGCSAEACSAEEMEEACTSTSCGQGCEKALTSRGLFSWTGDTNWELWPVVHISTLGSPHNSNLRSHTSGWTRHYWLMHWGSLVCVWLGAQCLYECNHWKRSTSRTEVGSRTSPIMPVDLDIPVVWKDGSFKATTLAEEPIDQPQRWRKSVCQS